MSKKFWIQVYEASLLADNTVLFEDDVNLPMKIGRQEAGVFTGVQLIEHEDGTATLQQPEFGVATSRRKLLIASPSERAYSRQFAELKIVDEAVEVKNTSGGQVIYLGAETPINPGESRLLVTPFEIKLGERMVSIARVGQVKKKAIIKSLPPTSPPSIMGSGSWATMERQAVSLRGTQKGAKIDGERLIELLQTIMQMLQDSPSTPEFYENATRSIAQLMELDNCLLVFDEGCKPQFGNLDIAWGRWHAQSIYPPLRESSEFAPSSKILRLVHQDKLTVYQIPDVRTESLIGVNSLVASPLKNASDDVIGVVYGDRRITAQSAFTETEAMFVDLFANGISVGLARMGQERQISEMRARFDQFFTPSLARQLEADPAMLEPRSANVSVLFADIRGFSRISERIGPDTTIQWINSLMSTLSDCVFKFEGVVVDYIGDEIMAMWGAPVDREDHAELAVKAALDMIATLPAINEQWEEILGEPVDIGIGVNSGEAQVGNTGSVKKFKYGPLGDVVNVGSRIQGATKQVQVRLLVAESTAKQLSAEIPRRKIRSVRFVNVKRAIAVYEIPTNPDENWNALKTEYEKGLDLYEKGDLAQASGVMGGLINRWKDDGPSIMLLSDSVKNLQIVDGEFDCVWQLDQK